MNLLRDYGYNEKDIHNRVISTFHTLFEGNDNERIYFEDKDGAYILDTGNNDVRSEGIGFAMMMAIQMDRQDIFDKLWSWAMKHMYIQEGQYKGYFHFACNTDGSLKNELPRPDGEEYISLSLLFASHRWENRDGIFDYGAAAQKILSTALHSENPLWNKESYLIKNKITETHSDVSYNLPHFYELYAMCADKNDHDFWSRAAGASREFIVRCTNKKTGMAPEYVTLRGEPLPEDEHGTFFSHSYLVAVNIATYTLWFGDTPEFATIAKNLLTFFDGKTVDEFMDYKINGTPRDRHSLHPIGLSACLGAVVMALERTQEPVGSETQKAAQRAVKRFWETPLRTDGKRYYDNCLYFLSLLALSGEYKVY